MSLKNWHNTAINDAINMLSSQLGVHVDTQVALSCRHSAKVLGTIVGNAIIAIVIYL